MAEGPYDFAVLGSTPLAALLAGLLGSVHQKRVLLIAEPLSPLRLQRGFDLAVAPLTRPETWAMLQRGTPEVLKLLSGLGKGLFQRLDPLFVAETAAGAEALAHMRHVARGFEYAVERRPGVALAAYRFQDKPLLDRARLGPAFASWFQRIGVLQQAAGTARISIARDGSARIETANGAIDAKHAILADDAAVIAQLGPNLPAGARIEPVTAILTEPAATRPAPLAMHVDTGVVLRQDTTAAIWALVPGPPSEAQLRIAATLASQGTMRRAGQVRFNSIATLDGAAIVGLARVPQVTLIAGLGSSGAFLAPALARLIAGSATEEEARYFAAREPGKDRTAIADYVPASLMGVAA
jgi:hypothetical protein